MNDKELTLDTGEEKSDKPPIEESYNEKMTFAAVGRLFDDEPRPPVEPAPQAAPPPPAPPAADEDERRAREEAALERPRRRGSATTRMLHNGTREEVMEAGLRDAAGNAAVDAAVAPPRHRERDRDKRRQSADQPKPAARVNVQTEHPQGEDGQDFGAFRNRYNPDELVSVNRNPNRPVRPGQRPPREREARPERVPLSTRNLDALSPLRFVFAAAGICAVIIIIVLFILWRGAAGDVTERDSEISRLSLQIGQPTEAHTQQVSNLNQQIVERDGTIRRLTDVLEHFEIPFRDVAQIPEDAPPPLIPGTDPPPAMQATTHTVAAGQLLGHIANLHFGSQSHAVLDHIIATNIERYPTITRDRVLVGWVLDIVPMEDTP
jgi:hypothetical protein